MPSDNVNRNLFDDNLDSSGDSPVENAPDEEPSLNNRREISPGLLNVGGLLQHRRKELELSLDDCHKMTRIRKVLLEALEEEDLKQLPASRTTVRAYVRAYAKCLDLDPEALVRQFNDLHYPHTETKTYHSTPKPLPSLSTNAILILFIALLIVGVLIGMMQYFLNQPNESMEVKISPPPKIEQLNNQQIPETPLPEEEHPANDTPVVSLSRAEQETPDILDSIRISHTEYLWVTLRQDIDDKTIEEAHFLEPAEALNIPLKVNSKLHILNSDNVTLFLVDQTGKVLAEVPYQAIADSKGWVDFQLLLQQ